jgi:hypothetical protein
MGNKFAKQDKEIPQTLSVALTFRGVHSLHEYDTNVLMSGFDAKRRRNVMLTNLFHENVISITRLRDQIAAVTSLLPLFRIN